MIYLVLCYDSTIIAEWQAYATFRDAARSYIEAADGSTYYLVTLCKLDLGKPFEPKITIIESVSK